MHVLEKDQECETEEEVEELMTVYTKRATMFYVEGNVAKVSTYTLLNLAQSQYLRQLMKTCEI